MCRTRSRSSSSTRGEVQLNHVVVGSDDKPALLLIPGQSESWWGYEEALPLLAAHFQAFAVDLRGQGRSTRTPGRYTLDNMGNDLVRFIDGVIRRPTFVSGLSSGGVLVGVAVGLRPSWPGHRCRLRGPAAVRSEVTPACGQSIRHGIGPMFALWSKYLGDQWSIGDWDAMVAAAPAELPAWIAAFASALGDGPPQNLKEYDPEWGRAFWGGTIAASCDHARMLAAVKTPVLLTHHFHQVDEATGALMGALSDLHAERAATAHHRGRTALRATGRSRPWATRCTARTPRCSPPPWPSGPTRSAHRQRARDRRRHREPLGGGRVAHRPSGPSEPWPTNRRRLVLRRPHGTRRP